MLKYIPMLVLFVSAVIIAAILIPSALAGMFKFGIGMILIGALFLVEVHDQKKNEHIKLGDYLFSLIFTR